MGYRHIQLRILTKRTTVVTVVYTSMSYGLFTVSHPLQNACSTSVKFAKVWLHCEGSGSPWPAMHTLHSPLIGRTS